jgi:rubrerythrin
MEREKLNELLYQALEVEKGGVEVYETALRCVVNEDLREEWNKYRDQTKRHVEILVEVMEKLGIEADGKSAGAEIVARKGQALVAAMEKALADGEPGAAQLVAAECVVDAESKDHLDWELLGEAAKELEGEEADALSKAVEEVEEEEDEHLYHSMGWARELWMEFLGLPAVLPPPEEKKHAVTAISAARAKQQRGSMTGRRRPANGKRRAAMA